MESSLAKQSIHITEGDSGEEKNNIKHSHSIASLHKEGTLMYFH